MSNLSFSYFSLLLKYHLQDISDPRADDTGYINRMASLAEDEFERCRLGGMTALSAHERAIQALTADISSSPAHPETSNKSYHSIPDSGYY